MQVGYNFITASNSTIHGENFENSSPELPKKAMKTNETCKFDTIIVSNSIMVGENFES